MPSRASITFSEAAEPDLEVAVDPQAGVLLHRLLEQLRPVVGEGGVDLVLAVTGYGHVGVAGERDQRRLTARRHRDQHDRVGPLTRDRTGAELLALGLGQPCPRVGPDEQEGGAGLVGGALARGRVVDVADLLPGVRGYADEPAERQHQQQRQHPQDGPGRTPPADALGGRQDQRGRRWLGWLSWVRAVLGTRTGGPRGPPRRWSGGRREHARRLRLGALRGPVVEPVEVVLAAVGHGGTVLGRAVGALDESGRPRRGTGGGGPRRRHTCCDFRGRSPPEPPFLLHRKGLRVD